MFKLKRDVGLVGATAYMLGIIIGAGIYVIIGKAAAITGSSLWVSFLIAAFIAACTGFSYAELVSSFPYDSAEYVYSERAFHDRRFAFGIGWIKFVTYIVATAAVALGFGGYLASLTGINFIVCALLLIFVLTLVNLVGVKQAVRFDTVMVAIAVIGLLLVIIFGLPSLHDFSFYLDYTSGFSGIMVAASLVFFAFLGFESVGNISEETRDPRRILPLALMLAIAISTVLYVVVAVVAVSVVAPGELGASVSPLADVMRNLMGSEAGIIMAFMALAATGSTVLGFLIGTSRIAYGMAEEGTLPKFLLKVSRKQRVPYIAVMVVAVICALLVLTGDITSITFLTDFGALFLFLVVNLCVIVLRYTHEHVPRSFKAPLNIGRFPVIPAVGLATCTVLLFSFSKKMFFLGIMIFLTGMFIYSVFGEHRYAARRAEKLALDLTANKRSVKAKTSKIKPANAGKGTAAAKKKK